MRLSNKVKMNGFTLIEVLVAMVVLAVGLLGLASLQALALKDNQDAYFRSQANFLIYEMSDRIRANAVYWKGTPVLPNYSSTAPPNDPQLYCSEPPNGMDSINPCSFGNMANYDIYHFWQSLVLVLPDPTLNITRTSDLLLTISLSWTRSNQALKTGNPKATLSLSVQL